ncbi:serine/threonine protein kinase [Streptomyces lunaelactis]|uniref:serine/threonine-protein kinase n=1 Tax=Streptomyces lunaelactis TaxID=1535768 RepID=UPI00158468BF|nr:serine/threonine-protein kinase [Streptomyces lunaelactis]NUK05965.1 serine/threonine protein kinase [Streptomyces lunaelactis]NUK12626.1 serine/threonine protein kinase [Streptomyces lunaelactis]NUK20455.1 serine/threonine protein kinase [Streptomyces lunaelactis]NUK38674.1 serine/threonine protein kinase [Streptomyces lunaelactis]NUK46101.1 serine/threonine protein kinase [Streptomyces lunaelactis]
MSDGESGRRVIDGRFELEARLGGGGMGMVWRARDLALDRAVALKEVRPPDPGLAEADPEAAAMLRERVLREARALARVNHPHVVTIYHVVDGAEHTYPWLVMELVTGGSLQDRLDKGPMTPVEAARMGRDVLAALRAAHDVGIQHRDVKPANVLMRPDGRPVLTDFGIAAIRESTSLTMTGSIIGTPDYMAPERISGDDGGPGSDLWSLAMMLYVAVEGNHPLRRGSTLATLAAVLKEELPSPRRAGALTGVLAAVLVKDPAARPDPETVDRMLAEAAQGEASTPSGTGGTTSYRLTPPPGPAPQPAPVTPPPAPPGFGPPMGFGPATPHDAVPRPMGPPTPYPVGPTGQTPPRTGARAKRRIAIASSVVGTVLAGVLVWSLLPDGGGQGDDTGSISPGGSSTTSSRTPTPTSTSSASPEKPEMTEKVDLLTPAGIRMAIKEIKAKTGTDRAGDFTVYPEHISVSVMVKGSDKRYDSWTYRVGEGATKGIISSTLMSGDLPFSLDDFDWDVVPALLTRAEKDLNVKNPTSRYLLVNAASETFDTPTNLAVYLADDYESGFLEADLKGKVTRVVPAEGG